MASITRQYPNIVKWLKAARAAALKERGTFQICTEKNYTYITDGVFALRIPAAQVPDWQTVINLASFQGQEMNAQLLETISGMFAPSQFDEPLLDTSILTHVKCQTDEPLCRVFAFQKTPYVIRENHAASLRDIDAAATVQGALTGSSRYLAKVVACDGLAALALPIWLNEDMKRKRILTATVKAALE